MALMVYISLWLTAEGEVTRPPEPSRYRNVVPVGSMLEELIRLVRLIVAGEQTALG